MFPRRFPISFILVLVWVVPAVLAQGDSCTNDTHCGENEFCAFLYGGCLADAPIGRCEFVPPGAGCTHLYMPVCGCDLQTYSNGCFASLAHASILYPGECQTCSAGASCGPERVCRVLEGGCAEGYEGVCVPPREHETVTFVFEGTVGSLFDGLGLLADDVGPGTRFHGSLTYDLTTPNTGGIGQGEFGVYLHESGPAGVRLVLGDLTVRSVPGRPELLVFVNNDVGFVGADEFGFESGNSELGDSPFAADVLGIELGWRLWEFLEDPIANVDLPVCPTDPALFENNDLRLFIECEPCLAPAAFVDLTGRIDLFESDLTLRVDREGLAWSSPESAIEFDAVVGDLFALGDFAEATTACIADDIAATSVELDQDPPPGQGWWFLVRPEREQGTGSWDSGGLQQQRPRDRGIAESGAGCS